MAEKKYIELGEAKRVMKANDWLNPAIPNVVNVILDRLPAADVVEVVRCKDCKWWWDNTGITKRPKGFCYEHGMCTNGDAFCSRGERKEATP